MSDAMYVPRNTLYQELYEELVSTPFYKTDDGYRFASFLLDGETNRTIRLAFESDKTPIEVTVKEWKRIVALLKESIKSLSAVHVSDEDLTVWMLFQKEEGGVEECHGIWERLREGISLIMFESYAMAEDAGLDAEGDTADEKLRQNAEYMPELCHYWNTDMVCVDRNAVWKKANEQSMSGDIVLNHNNPFADISIKEQQFLYGSIMGQFETLKLTTSLSCTKVPKDTERSYIALQPGFKIKKSKNTLKNNVASVIFDDTLTTEITQKDNNVYVHLN